MKEFYKCCFWFQALSYWWIFTSLCLLSLQESGGTPAIFLLLIKIKGRRSKTSSKIAPVWHWAYYSNFLLSTQKIMQQLLLFSCLLLSNSLRPQASLSFTVSCSLLRFMSIESVTPSNHLILCCRFLLLPSIFPSIRVFYNELALCIQWPKYWSFSISPSNEYSGLISFKSDWLDLFEVQGTLKSLP